jgi:C_GCAxxG_C_C family probable redox protein
VFSAVAEQLGMDYQTAVKVSCGFGGGMYLGSVCGAVTGGIMAIGLKHGGAGTQASVRTAAIVRQFADRFKAQHRSISCPELIGVALGKVDLANPQALGEFYKAAQEKKAFAGCAGFVADAAKIASELVSG